MSIAPTFRHAATASLLFAGLVTALLLPAATPLAGAGSVPPPSRLEPTHAPAPQDGATRSNRSAPRRVSDQYRKLTIRTVPAVPGVVFRFLDQNAATDASGIATLSITVDERTQLARDRAAVLSVASPTVPLDATHRATFSGWLGKGTYRWSPTDDTGAIETATFTTDRLMNFRFVDHHGAPIAARQIDRFAVRSNAGEVHRFSPHTQAWLPATEVINGPTGPKVRDISYSVTNAEYQQSNVVNSGQQHFTPADDPKVAVSLLIFRVTFHAVDTIFGTPVRGSLVLTYPDGSIRSVPLVQGRATLDRMPRGLYDVSFKGSAPTRARPVTISSAQVIRLDVVTWRDIAVAMVLGAVIMVAVLGVAFVVRRRHRHATATAPTPLDVPIPLAAVAQQDAPELPEHPEEPTPPEAASEPTTLEPAGSAEPTTQPDQDLDPEHADATP